MMSQSMTIQLSAHQPASCLCALSILNGPSSAGVMEFSSFSFISPPFPSPWSQLEVTRYSIAASRIMINPNFTSVFKSYLFWGPLTPWHSMTILYWFVAPATRPPNQQVPHGPSHVNTVLNHTLGRLSGQTNCWSHMQYNTRVLIILVLTCIYYFIVPLLWPRPLSFTI